MPKDLNAKRIESKEEYDKLFPTEKGERARLLKIAMDVRKFEIEMYWKRTAFFWAFIVSIYTAFFFLLTSQDKDEYSIYLVGLSFLAVIFSIAWIFANKGSKFWQENWEQHVGLLEDEPLYDVFLNPKEVGSWVHPFKEYDFSVSKINLFLSYVVLVVSLVVLGISVYNIYQWSFCECKCAGLAAVVFFIVLIVGTIVGFSQCKGHRKLKFVKNNEKSPFMPMIYVQRGKNED